MSIFASRTQKTVTIPHDPQQHTVTIQKLAGRHFQKARDGAQFESIQNLMRLGGAAFQRELDAITASKGAKETAKQVADPLNLFDHVTVLRHGVVAWSCQDDAGKPIPVNDETLDDLDEDARGFLVREILQLSKPSLFQTAEEAEAATKNA